MNGDHKTDIRDVAMVTDKFWGLFSEVKNDCLHSLLWRSTTDWLIVKRL